VRGEAGAAEDGGTRGGGEGGGSGRVSRRAGKDRRKPGTSRFCYDQWRTGTQRALLVSIRGKEGESERGTLVGLSVECLSLPGSPHPSSARILRLPRFSEASRRAGPRRIFLLFVRFIARPLCLPSFFSFFSWSSLAPRTYSPDVLESKFDDEDKSSSRIPDVRDGRVNDRHCVDSLDDDCTALARTVRFIQSTSLSMTTLAD